MSSNGPVFDYEPIVPARARRGREAEPDEEEFRSSRFDDDAFAAVSREASAATTAATASAPATTDAEPRLAQSGRRESVAPGAVLKRGHSLTYAGLFLFTAVLYFRPYELIPALSSLTSLAFFVALATLAVFIPSQVSLEGTLTARPREVNLLLLFWLTALLSIPLAMNHGEAFESLTDFTKVLLVFVIAINAVRTERRLRLLVLVVLAASGVLAVSALNDYRAGNLTVEGYRVSGAVGGLFGNPNDLALHFATAVPLAVVLFLATRGVHKKLVYAGLVALMMGALMVTFSRGGFLGMAAALLVLGWKLGRRNRLLVVLATVILLVAAFAFAPGEYTGRLASIFDRSLDLSGSASSRQELLIRSIIVAVQHPLLGVGMSNFHIVSIHEQVSHNAYTQVAAELGAAALVLYVLFLLSPLKRLRRIERETLNAKAQARFYYLSVGIQASLVAYMVSSFFASVAYQWYVYYIVIYAVSLRRIYESAQSAEGKSPALVDKSAQGAAGAI